jgi:hypothetical protein
MEVLKKIDTSHFSKEEIGNFLELNYYYLEYFNFTKMIKIILHIKVQI